MKQKQSVPTVLIGAVLCLGIVACQSALRSGNDGNPLAGATTVSALSSEELTQVAEDSFIYGYPLVLMEITKDQLTNVPSPTAESAPLNQFAHQLTAKPTNSYLADPSGVETLYSSAWLDLSREPMVLSLPDIGQRYFLMPMLSAWSDVFASPGTRTTGNKKKDLVIIGPRWNGLLPQGLVQIKSPTNDVWIIGRTQARSSSDLKLLNKMRDAYRLTPLSEWGEAYTPPKYVAVKKGVDITTDPAEQIEKLAGVNFFQRMAEALKRNPPAPQDTVMVNKLRQMSVIVGRSFDVSKLRPDQVAAINEGARQGLTKILESGRSSQADRSNGWVYQKNLSPLDYRRRALRAQKDFLRAAPEDVFVMTARVDGMGQTLRGSHRYTLRFSKNQQPPSHELWSLHASTAQGKNGMTLNSRRKLQYRPDGSLELYIQHDRPEPAKLSNWLQVPAGEFELSMRLYWPRDAVLKGEWRMPPVHRTLDRKQLSQGEPSDQ